MIDSTFAKKSYTKTSPCLVTISEKTLLNKQDSVKQTYHISLNIENTDLHFQPGDSLAILPQNDPKFVLRLLSILKISPDQSIIEPRSGESSSSFDFFTKKVNLSQVPPSLVRNSIHFMQNHEQKERLSVLIDPLNKTLLQEFLQGKDLIEFFEEYSIDTSCFSFYEYLAPLLPRFYSISSSLNTHPQEVHLLVALSSYEYKEEIRYGIASHFLCNLAVAGETKIPLYVQPSRHFRLPEDPKADLIMIGPGTGVAPYRAFLQERIHQGAEGKNWLFFGGRNKGNDFFYEDFWSHLLLQGKMKLSTAFSRDKAEKEYVQHKLLEEAEEIWQWLENGAYFYVCGDASKMAKDVEQTLLSIIQKQGNLSEEQAKLYYKALKTSKRYLADVY